MRSTNKQSKRLYVSMLDFDESNNMMLIYMGNKLSGKNCGFFFRINFRITGNGDFLSVYFRFIYRIVFDFNRVKIKCLSNALVTQC